MVSRSMMSMSWACETSERLFGYSFPEPLEDCNQSYLNFGGGSESKSKQCLQETSTRTLLVPLIGDIWSLIVGT